MSSCCPVYGNVSSKDSSHVNFASKAATICNLCVSNLTVTNTVSLPDCSNITTLADQGAAVTTNCTGSFLAQDASNNILQTVAQGNTVNIEFRPAPYCSSILQWDGALWQVVKAPSITAVSVGPVGSGALYPTIETALQQAPGCPFIRVLADLVEPNSLTLPRDVVIYVDPGVTLTFARALDITNSSFTLRGNASLNSSTINITGQLKCGNGTQFYAHDCKIGNLTGGPLISGSPDYGKIEVYNTNFVTADRDYCLFGDNAGNGNILLQIHNCFVTGGGTSAQYFLGLFNDKTTVIHIRGLNVIGTFATSGVLARTITNDFMIDNVNILAAGSTIGAPFIWNVNCVCNNFKQGSGIYVNLRLESGGNRITNAFVHDCDVITSGAQLNNVSCTGNITVSGRNNLLTNCLVGSGQLTIVSPAPGPLNEAKNNEISNSYFFRGFNITSGRFNIISGCANINSCTLNDTDNVITNCTFTNGDLILTGGNVCARTIIGNCRLLEDTGAAVVINVNNNRNVLISNCMVGQSLGSAGSTIVNPNPNTLITGCYTRALIVGGSQSNCQVF